MEPWNYVTENKGLLNVEGIGSQGFADMEYEEETIRKSWEGSSSVTIANYSSEFVANRSYTPVTSSAVSVYSGNGVSSSIVVESNNQDLSFVDLNLGRLSDNRDLRSSKVAPIGSSVDSSSTPTKRARGNLSSQGAFCQVHGCKKDLSGCKDYHKRHKVCEIHSKTAKVIVNGIEQRFCQQCSRFHLLVEFDDGKRSCRKRLAGHNERRRKPPSGRYAGHTGRLIHSYYGSMGCNPPGITLATSSITSQGLSDLTYPFGYNSNDLNMYKNPQEGVTISHPHSDITVTHGYQNSKSPFPLNLSKNIPPFHFNDVSSSSGGDLSETTSQNLHENFILFDTSSAVQGPQGISPAGHALSLLSSQSRSSTNHSSGFLFPNFSSDGLSNKFRGPTGLFSFDEGNNSLSYDNPIEYGDGIFQGSEYVNIGKARASCEEGAATIDLLQLSSQLQRVEHERHYIKPNQENGSIP